MLCLDTNIAIALLRGGRPDVEERIRRASIRHGRMSLSSIVLMELTYGVRRSPDKARRALDGFLAMPFDILPFTEVDAGHAGAIRASLSSRGLSIGGFDVLIAAQALTAVRRWSPTKFANSSALKDWHRDWLSPAP